MNSVVAEADRKVADSQQLLRFKVPGAFHTDVTSSVRGLQFRPLRPHSSVGNLWTGNVYCPDGRRPLSARGALERTNHSRQDITISSLRTEKLLRVSSSDEKGHHVKDLLDDIEEFSLEDTGQADVVRATHCKQPFVAIFPSSSAAGIQQTERVPPVPLRFDPSPRRRISHMTLSQQRSASSATCARAQHLKELKPALSAIASIGYEAHLGKLASQIQSIVLETNKMMQPVRPVESDNCFDMIQPAKGISGQMMENAVHCKVDDLYHHPHFDELCDVGHDSTDSCGGNNVRMLCCPAKDKTNLVLGSLSALRLRPNSLPFTEEDEIVLDMIATQAGIAISHSLQHQQIIRAKKQSTVLAEAATALSSSNVSDMGTVICLAKVYAKNIMQSHKAEIFLTYNKNTLMRTWEVKDLKETFSISISGEDYQEVSQLSVPLNLKGVVLKGLVINTVAKYGTADFDDQSGKEVGASIADKTDGEETLSVLAVPLQTESGSPIVGLIKITAKTGDVQRLGTDGKFSKQDECMLRNLAQIVAAAIRRVEQNANFSKMLSLIPSLAMQRHEVTIIRGMEELCRVSLGADIALMFVLNDEHDFIYHSHGEAFKTANNAPDVMKFPSSTYPLSAGMESGEPQVVLIKNVSERILAQQSSKHALIRSAQSMYVCTIRDVDASSYGVIVIAYSRDDKIPSSVLNLFKSVCQFAGSVLNNRTFLHNAHNFVSELQSSSVDLLNIARHAELESLIQHVATQVNVYMKCRRAVLYLLDNDRKVLWTLLLNGSIVLIDHTQGITMDNSPPRTGFACIAASQNSIVNVKDFAHCHKIYNDLVDSADIDLVEKLNALQSGAVTISSPRITNNLEANESTESVLAIPVRDETDKVLAVLQVMNKLKNGSTRKASREGFDGNDVNRLELIASAVATSLNGCRTLERRWKTENELRSLLENSVNERAIALGTCSRIEIMEAMTFMAKSACAMCDATQASIFILDKDGEFNIFRFEGNLFLPMRPFKAPVTGIAGKVISTGTVWNIADCHSDPDFDPLIDQKEFIPVVSLVAGPIRNPVGKIVGALMFQNKRLKAKYNDSETDLLSAHLIHTMRKQSVKTDCVQSGWKSFNANDERIIESAAVGLGIALSMHDLLDQVSAITQRVCDISLDLDLDSLSERTSSACKQICSAERCLVFFREDDGHMKCKSGAQISLDTGLGIPGMVMVSSRIVHFRVAEDSKRLRDGLQVHSAAARYLEMLQDLRNAMAVPIVDGEGHVHGVIEVHNKMGYDNEFTKADERGLLVVASQVQSMLTHCKGYIRAQNHLRRQRDITNGMEDLLKRVAVDFSISRNIIDGYARIVQSLCQMLHVSSGRMYLTRKKNTGKLISYDAKGVESSDRANSAVEEAFQLGSVINTSEPKYHARKQQSHSANVSPTGQEEYQASIPSKELTFLCAPIFEGGLQVGHHGTADTFLLRKARLVIGVLQVQETGRTWNSDDVSLIESMAGIARSVIELMTEMREKFDQAVAERQAREDKIFARQASLRRL